MHPVSNAMDVLYSTQANDPLLCERIERFVSETPERVAELLEAVRQEAWPEVVRQVQLIKNMSVSHGFARIGAAAAEVEQLIQDRRPETLVHQAVGELIAIYSRVRAGTV